MIPRIKQIPEQGASVEHRADDGVVRRLRFGGGNAAVIQALANTAKEQPVDENSEHIRVNGGEWRDPSTKTGRQSIANDLGLPNIKGGRHKSWEAALDYAARNKPF